MRASYSEGWNDAYLNMPASFKTSEYQRGYNDAMQRWN